MAFPRAVLVVVGLIFVALGVAFLLNAQSAANALLLRSAGLNRVSIRAVDGGLQLGLGVFFLVANARERWIRAGLGAVMLTCGGLVVGRTVGMLKEGQFDQTQIAFVAGELLAVVIAWAAFVQARAIWEAVRTERRRMD